MARALFYFIQLALLVAAAVWLGDHPGRLSIDWMGYRIETYFGVLVLVVVLVVIVLAAIYRTWHGLTAVPARFMSNRADRRRADGYKALTLGMTAVAAGDAEEAKKQARRADGLLREPSVTRLLSAQAASLNGDSKAAERYFKALLENPETEFLGLTGLMRIATERGEVAETHRLADRAFGLRPDSPLTFTTLLELQAREGDWAAALTTLRDGMRHKLLTEAVGGHHRTALLTEQARAATAAGQSDAAIDLADKALSGERDFVPAAVLKAEALRRTDRSRKASRLVEDFWRHSPHPDLAESYKRIWPGEDPLELIKRLQRLVSANPDALESRLLVAAGALDADLWGEARKQLDLILDVDRTPRVHRLRARLEEAEHGNTEAARAELERATLASADVGWTCGQCGAGASEWRAICGNCDAFDTINWRAPPRVSMLKMLPSDIEADGTGENSAKPTELLESGSTAASN
jgi:HemY protein